MEQPGNVEKSFRRGAVVDWGSQEVLNDFLYDWLAYPVGGQVQLNFFTTPQGQGASIWDATQTKTYEDTNMEVGSQMARGEAFLVQHVALRFWQATLPIQQLNGAAVTANQVIAANDAYLFWSHGFVEFKVVNKVQLRQGPLSSFPPPTRLNLDAAAAAESTVAATTNQVIGSHLSPVGPLYTIASPGITLEYGMKFSFTLNWSIAQAIVTAGRVQAMLIGKRMRVGQ